MTRGSLFTHLLCNASIAPCGTGIIASGLLLPAALLATETPDAPEIMPRVAKNQNRTQPRASWVFDQNVFVRLQRPGGKLAREKNRKYTVAPTEKGARRKIVSVEGKILDGNKETNTTPPDSAPKTPISTAP